MRRAVALLLLLAFSVAAVAAAAEDITGILPAGGNNGSTVEDPGLGKTGQNGETNPDTEHKVHKEGGLDNAIAGNNNTDTSIQGTSTGRDDPVQKPSDKDENTTTTTSSTGFLQDPLVSGCDPSHSCLIEKHKFIACLKVSGDSSALSLLMDNKGVNPLDVSITAPDYVTIAEDTVHVEANDHNETQVSVSVSDTMNDMAIVLKVAEETCRINLDTAVTRNRGRPSNSMPNLSSKGLASRKSTKDGWKD